MANSKQVGKGTIENSGLPISRPLKVENTKGVKEADSTLRTWSP